MKNLVRYSCQVLGLVGVLSLSFGHTSFAVSEAGSDTTPGDPAPHGVSLCEWQRDFDFFTATPAPQNVDTIPCDRVFVAETIPLAQAPDSPTTIHEDRRAFETELQSMLAGYPIEAMVSTIAEYDRDVAGLIVGIAKKESNWGKRVPRTSEGDDCFNYWGYKGAGARGVAMGHGCFGASAEAVHVIGHRLQELITLRRSSDPASLVIWKCGSSCSGHSPESVQRWISDVDLYYRTIARK